MEKDAITATVEKAVKEVCGVDCVKESDRFKEDLGLDSLNLVSLIVAVEDALQIEFDAAALDPEVLVDVHSLITLVDETLGAMA